MDFCHQRISGGCYERKRVEYPAAFGISPFAPESCQGHRLAILPIYKKWVRVAIKVMVFIKTIYIHNASVVFCRGPKGRFFKNGFPAGIEGVVPLFFKLLLVPHPMGNQAPSGHLRKLGGPVCID